MAYLSTNRPFSGTITCALTMPTAVLLLVVVSLFIIYRIGREVFASRRHLTEEELLDYHQGRLAAEDRAAFRRVSAHLADCEACRDRFDEIVIRTKGQGGHYIDRRF